jgi:hypothetical protein
MRYRQRKPIQGILECLSYRPRIAAGKLSLRPAQLGLRQSTPPLDSAQDIRLVHDRGKGQPQELVRNAVDVFVVDVSHFHLQYECLVAGTLRGKSLSVERDFPRVLALVVAAPQKRPFLRDLESLGFDMLGRL